MPHWPKPLIGNGMKEFSLEAITELLDRLGNPQAKIPPVIYVSGTNGKGSTIAFLRAILNAAGYSVHVYTSPHLRYFNERFVIADKMVDDRILYSLLEDCRSESDGLHLTFFEGTTAAAFLAFSRFKADFTLVEVGCGGRLDATNVMPNVLVSVITAIDYDHTEVLGENPPFIAWEKAHIMRRGSRCVIGYQSHPEVYGVLERHAIENSVSVFRGGKDWVCAPSESDAKMIKFSSGGESVELPKPILEGDHQIRNAGNAIAVCSLLSFKLGYAIAYEHIVEGLSTASWPARLERIKQGPLLAFLPSDKWQIYLDGAHNVAGAMVLRDWAKGKEIFLVVGMTKDRDSKAFLEIIQPVSIGLCGVCVHSEPRSQTSESIYKSGLQAGFTKVFDCESVIVAMKHIRSECSQSHKDRELCILICGSLFLAGDVLKDFIVVDSSEA